ncbi:Flp pilus assembly protein TadB [Desulfocapsa sulfexigens DSM 10523]|uniref:Flp pilus assembly protein TadB n=1 Tax=Desulfocapsa sulfexigens (strain DSM 10523 / SB164P1) TaxID=1167006 RepID=M1PK04_DESSD|nr:type II secretion system F family protein [Desulfocapsa sulfexigens]AGF76841.1 Flp pilus assembly protein TadB [Desulfocapsa sulfexigens DSM 10523]
MTENLYNIILGLSVSASILFTLMGVLQLSKLVPEEDREFMDPLPPLLDFIWPLARIIAYYGCSRIPFSYLKSVEGRLKRNGLGHMMIAEEFIALRIIAASVALLSGYILITLLAEWNPILYIVLPALGFFYPDIWLRDIRKKQVDAVLRTLPAYLDFITMAVEAGLNFSGAIAQARTKGPAGPLVIEFGIVLRDMRSGIPRTRALKRMAKRLDIHEISSFVNAVVQAEKMGSSMAGVLRIQAEQRRSERFQRAEKKAMEAPVKLIGPLVIFIFPTTFIVLAFPIAIKFIQGGYF